MKLTDLNLNATAQETGVSLNHLHPGLNLVFADRREILESLGNLIEHTLATTGTGRYWATDLGWLQATSGQGSFRLQRSVDPQRRLDVQCLAGSPGDVMTDASINALLPNSGGRIRWSGLQPNQSLLEAIQAAAPAWSEYARQQRFRSEREYLDWKSAADGRLHRLEALRSERSALEAERSRLLAEIDAMTRDDARQRERCDQEIARLDAAIAAADREVQQRRKTLAELEAEILRLQRESRPLPPRPDVKVEWSRDLLATLYARIDDLEEQIVRWTELLEDVHGERIRLRDEMVRWNELTVKDPEHPYHRAQAIISNINATVDEADRTALQHVEDASVEARQAARKVSGHCDQIHSQLNELSDELGAQFKELRHRVAVNELKLLRGYYHRIGDHLQRLQQLLQGAIQALRIYDEVGARAVESRLPEFVATARQVGFLQARRQFHGPEPVIVATNTVPQDASFADQTRLRLLQVTGQRDTCVDELERAVALIASLNEEREKWIAQRRLLAGVNPAPQRLRLDQIASLLNRLLEEEANLLKQIELDRQQPAFVPNPLEQAASRYLSQLTGVPSSISFWHGEPSNSGTLESLSVAINRQESRPVNLLTANEQRLVALALQLATLTHLNPRGYQWPIVLEHWAEYLDEGQVQRIVGLLEELGRAGLQTILLWEGDGRTRSWLQNFGPGKFGEFQIATVATTRRIVTSPREPVPVPVVAPSVSIARPTAPASLAAEPRLPDWTRYNLQTAFTAPETPHVYVDRGIEVPPLTRATVAHEPTAAISESTSLGDVDLLDHVHLRNLALCGIHNFGQLLELDPESLPDLLLNKGFTPAQIDRWQAQAWLLLCVPGLVPSESRLLVACGIVEPEQLDATQADQLLARINRYLISPDGQRMSYGAERFDRNRIQSWYDGLRSTRSRWRREGGYSRRLRRRASTFQAHPRRNVDERPARGSFTSGRYFERVAQRTYQPGHHFSSFPRAYVERTVDEELEDQDDADEILPTTPRQPAKGSQPVESSAAFVRPRPGIDVEPRSPLTRAPSDIELEPRKRPENVGGAAGNHKFYLNLADPVEAAPSIGPKTAERFIAIGVHTIHDFLNTTAETMAERIDFKRISADVIRTWQAQARLVCCVPNLRGHDAQLLVACGVTEAEQLAQMNPRKLFSLVGPFADTKEGLKIIRSGKKPDLEEVTEWIEWAHHTRPLQAA